MRSLLFKVIWVGLMAWSIPTAAANFGDDVTNQFNPTFLKTILNGKLGWQGGVSIPIYGADGKLGGYKVTGSTLNTAEPTRVTLGNYSNGKPAYFFWYVDPKTGKENYVYMRQADVDAMANAKKKGGSALVASKPSSGSATTASTGVGSAVGLSGSAGSGALIGSAGSDDLDMEGAEALPNEVLAAITPGSAAMPKIDPVLRPQLTDAFLHSNFSSPVDSIERVDKKFDPNVRSVLYRFTLNNGVQFTADTERISGWQKTFEQRQTLNVQTNGTVPGAAAQ